MKTSKISLQNIEGKLCRVGVKNIMAGNRTASDLCMRIRNIYRFCNTRLYQQTIYQLN